MAHDDQDADRQDRNVEAPGDTNSADIVDRTGEQMPQQSHDGVTEDDRTRSTHVNDEERVGETREGTAGDAGRHDNPRTGRVSDW